MTVTSQPRIQILAVDDDRQFVELTAERLELDLDYDQVEITTETDAKTALDRATDDIDCIVSDYQMPGMDGLEFLDAVREHCPNIPFILFTGKGSEEVASDAIAAGVTDYIQKSAGTEQYELLANRITNAVEQHRTRQKLQRNERRLKALFENSTDRISILDADGRYTFVSPAVERLMGHDPEELVGESGFEYIHPEDHAKTRATLEQIIDDPEGVYSVEYRYQDGEGSWRWVETRARNRLDDPAIEGIVLNSRDITERKRHEQRIQQQQRRLDTLLSNVPVVLWEIDEDGVFTEADGQALQKIGFNPAESIGESVFEVFADHPAILDYCERALKGESIATTVEVGGVIFESWYEPVRDGDGDVTGVVGLAYDITERQEQKRKREQIIDRVTDAVAKVDEDWQFTLVDDRAEELLEEGEQDLLGRNLWDVFAEARDTTFEETYRRVMETRDATSLEAYYPPLDRWLCVHVYPDDDGGLSFYFRDISERKEYEKDLERQNELFRKAQDIAGVGAWTYDVRTDENIWTEEVHRIYDLPMDCTPTAEDGVEFYHPDDRPLVREKFENAVENGEPYDIEVRLITANDEQRWVRTRGDPQEEDGEIVRVRGTIQDITDRKERQQELKEYETIIEALSDAVYVLDEEGQFAYVNDEFVELVGYDRETILGSAPSLIKDEETVEQAEQELGRLLSSTGPEATTFEVTIHPRDGDPVVCEDHMGILPYEGDEFDGSVGTLRDITDRKERERELQRLKERFQQVFEQSNDAIMIVDTDDKEFVEVNQAACEMLDYTHEELLALHPEDIHPDDFDQVREEFLSEVYETGSGWTDRLSCVTKHGEEIPTEISGATLQIGQEENQPSKMVAILRDVSDQVAYERELERQNERLENFASIVSHDLRNPLTLAEGYLKVLRETGDETVLDDMEAAHDRMRTIINDVLTVAREGQTVQTQEQVDFPELIQAAWDGVDTGGATIHTEELPGEVMGDETRLQRVFENLFRNAIDHAGENVTVTVGCLRDEQGVYIADDGPGIPEGEREDVFEWGYSTAEDGTGYGLAIVNDLIEAHGWTVTVTESESDGTRFEILGIETQNTVSGRNTVSQ